MDNPTKADSHQIGGAHYQQMSIQPWAVITAWGLGFLDGNAVKYISRWRVKGGIEDLKKARHYLDKLIEQEAERINNDNFANLQKAAAAARTPTHEATQVCGLPHGPLPILGRRV